MTKIKSKPALRKYECKIWERAEHWYFYATVYAIDDMDAWKQARKDFPKREYNVISVQHFYSPFSV